MSGYCPKSGIIYKATNLINGKVYIGKTVSTLHYRKNKHRRNASPNGESRKSAFYAAINKYGWENFKWEIVEQGVIPAMLGDLEVFYIKKYKCKVPCGYNLTDGGEGSMGFRHSVESRNKMSEANRGRYRSPETIKRMSAAQLGKHHTDETREKLRRVVFSEDRKKKISIAMRAKLETGWRSMGKKRKEYMEEKT